MLGLEHSWTHRESGLQKRDLVLLLLSLSYMISQRAVLNEVWAQASGSFSLGASCLKESSGKCQLHIT